MAVTRFSVSLEKELLEELDSFAESNGFANRSQALRHLIEKNIVEENGSATMSLPVPLL